MQTRIPTTLQKRLKSKKGSILIEYVIGLLMFVVFLAFCVDAVIIGYKHYYIGDGIAAISRTLAVQSGAEVATPQGFPGGDTAYMTSKEILERFQQIADVAGFKEGDWGLYYEEIDTNGNVVKSGQLTEKTNFKATYLNKISIEFRGTYQWRALSGAIPGIGRDRILTIKRTSMAEFVRSYD